MKIEKNYYDTPACIFSEIHPHFWKILRKYDYNEEELYYIFKTVSDNIANFSTQSLETVSYCIDFQAAYSEETKSLIHYCENIHKLAKYESIKADAIHDSIVQIIDKRYIYNNKISYPHHLLTTNYVFNEQSISYCLCDLNYSRRRAHYYIMLYIFDLTMKMQKIKSEIIKYELARYGKQSGTVLDVIINENMLHYMDLNKEFVKYNGILRTFNYYGPLVGLFAKNGNIFCPDNNHILCIYYNKQFDFENNRIILHHYKEPQRRFRKTRH
jgi:hypothetical protein